ncbi:hypothetical protein N2152v2_001383 [Parachlorella kessleri]
MAGSHCASQSTCPSHRLQLGSTPFEIKEADQSESLRSGARREAVEGWCRSRSSTAIVHARKSPGNYGQYSDYYSSDEAKELSKILPADPTSLFEDSVPPSAADLGLYASLGATAASSAAANRLFGGDLHSSLDDSLYSDAYSEEFNSFRDPGPDAGPWFSQQSPINSGLSLDEDLEVRPGSDTLAGIGSLARQMDWLWSVLYMSLDEDLEVLSDEAKAYRQWELQKALDKALELSSYQITHTVNRYMISVEHSRIMEELEIEDAHRLDGGGSSIPPWIRAVYKVQEDFDALNERERGWLLGRRVLLQVLSLDGWQAASRMFAQADEQAWEEEQMSLEEQRRVDEDVARAVEQALSLERKLDITGTQREQSNEPLQLEGEYDYEAAMLLGDTGSVGELDALMAGGPDPALQSEDESGLDGIMQGPAQASELSAAGVGPSDAFAPANFLPGVGGQPRDDLGGGEPAAVPTGGIFQDPRALPGMPPAAAAAPRFDGADGSVDSVQLSPQQALDDMDAEFDRREAAWDDEVVAEQEREEGEDNLAAGSSSRGGGSSRSSSRGSIATAQRSSSGLSGSTDDDLLYRGSGPAAAADLYATQYIGEYTGGELDDELGAWWADEVLTGESGEEELLDPEAAAGAEDVDGLGPLLLGDVDLDDELGSGDSEEEEEDDEDFSRSDLWRLRELEQELEGRQSRGGSRGRRSPSRPQFSDDDL